MHFKTWVEATVFVSSSTLRGSLTLSAKKVFTFELIVFSFKFTLYMFPFDWWHDYLWESEISFSDIINIFWKCIPLCESVEMTVCRQIFISTLRQITKKNSSNCREENQFDAKVSFRSICFDGRISNQPHAALKAHEKGWQPICIYMKCLICFFHHHHQYAIFNVTALCRYLLPFLGLIANGKQHKHTVQICTQHAARKPPSNIIRRMSYGLLMNSTE